MKYNELERRHLSLSLDDNFLNQTLVLPEIKVVYMTKSHTRRGLSIVPDHREANILKQAYLCGNLQILK